MSEPLWTVDAMAQAMGAERAGALPATIGGISIDSRSIVLGEAFFAITGDNRDGHEFVPAALNGGAGRDRNRRPSRGHCLGDRGAAPRRRAAGRRQGP